MFGSKSAPSASNGLHAALPQQVVQLAVNELDALAVRVAAVAGLDRQRAVEVVDDEQQLLQQIDDGLVGLLAALALDALAIVVELGRLAQPPIVVVVALAAEIVGRVAARSGVMVPSADIADRGSVAAGDVSAGSGTGLSAIRS